MFIVTLESLPGYEIELVLGAVMSTPGVNVGAATMSAYASVFGGREVSSAPYRDRAIGELVEQARQLGANVILALRIEATGAYGTAVRAVPVTPAAIEHYEALARAGHVPPLM